MTSFRCFYTGGDAVQHLDLISSRVANTHIQYFSLILKGLGLGSIERSFFLGGLNFKTEVITCVNPKPAHAKPRPLFRATPSKGAGIRDQCFGADFGSG